ncbi:hypothetical protein B0H14DRAFT_429101 [Mycena olivaceomarginata]|nr:hypothetical protein B0H14DRAFT_429101 [Mycena olivaceomarginata]
MAIDPSLQVSDGLPRRPFKGDVFGLRLLVQNLDTRTDRNFVIELWINALHFILAFSNKTSKVCYSVWPTCLVPQIRDPRFVASGPTSQSHRNWASLKIRSIFGEKTTPGTTVDEDNTGLRYAGRCTDFCFRNASRSNLAVDYAWLLSVVAGGMSQSLQKVLPHCRGTAKVVLQALKLNKAACHFRFSNCPSCLRNVCRQRLNSKDPFISQSDSLN